MHTGYVRCLLVLLSCFQMPTNYGRATVFYILSVLLDEFDGWAARKFKQGT